MGSAMAGKKSLAKSMGRRWRRDANGISLATSRGRRGGGKQIRSDAAADQNATAEQQDTAATAQRSGKFNYADEKAPAATPGKDGSTAANDWRVGASRGRRDGGGKLFQGKRERTNA
mmetsp:Transcript_38311/g.81800  ORF Transcript_38311/g.81800 Transcript_38311/m.81800 type:complete len:117 (+) Transcript_38311:732-1082(+)